MQTFLPFESFDHSAEVLDSRRLNKQKIECFQIHRTLIGETQGWRNHPASKMWADTPHVLCSYALAICSECTVRGIRDNAGIERYFLTRLNPELAQISPWWLGHAPFHRSHRSNLLRKDPEHYARFFEPGLPDDLPYWWPTKHASALRA